MKKFEEQVFTISDASVLETNAAYSYEFKDARQRILIGKLSDRIWSISMRLTLKAIKDDGLKKGDELYILNEASRAKFHINEAQNGTNYTFGATMTSDDHYINVVMDPNLRLTLDSTVAKDEEVFISISGIIVLNEGDKMICDV